MKSEFEALEEKYESDVKKLQRTCPHKRKSEWREQWWALGHSTGYIVRVCLNCNRILDKKKVMPRFRQERWRNVERTIKKKKREREERRLANAIKKRKGEEISKTS